MTDDPNFIDVVEICGGAERTSKMLIRRFHKVKVGLNFDAVVGYDLMDPKTRPLPLELLNENQTIGSSHGHSMHRISRGLSP